MDIIKKELDSYDGHKVTKITLINDNGVEISCLTMGAIWQEFLVPAGNSKKNMLLGFEHTEEYYKNAQCVCKFTEWNWNYTTSQNKNSVSVIFQKKITEEMDGFPGDILATIIYTLNNNNKVTIAYSALGGEVDTLFNPTMHVYFNPSDRPDLSTLSLKVNSHEFLDLGEHNIPTGRIREVEGTPCDFREFRNLKDADEEKGGFDDVFVVNEPGHAALPIAVLRDEESGRQITINSERNGLVMYTMPELDAEMRFTRDGGALAKPGEGVALEAQTLPDAINQENFGDIILPRQGKRTYRIQYAYDKIK